MPAAISFLPLNVPSTLNVFQTKPLIDDVLEFKGYGNCRSTCRIRIFESGCWRFVVMTDTGVGTSVTNAAEIIINAVRHKHLYNHPLDQIAWFEHYESNKHRDTGELDRIIPEWEQHRCTNVEWRHFAKIKA